MKLKRFEQFSITDDAIEKFYEYVEDQWIILIRNINNGILHEKWNVIPFRKLQKLWNDSVRYGFVRDEKTMNWIKELCLNNIAQLSVNTTMVGHGEFAWQNYILEHGYVFKDKKKKEYDKELNYTEEEFQERAYEYIGYNKFSDYALKPLINLAVELIMSNSSEQDLIICDKIFNVIHQRGDIAELFIQGGSESLFKLSGTFNESKKIVYKMKHLLEYIEYVDFKIRKTVCGLIINNNNEILILKRGSTAPWMPNKWSLCGGIINKNETKENAIVREIKEETNLDVNINDLTLYKELYDKEENYYLTCYKIKIFDNNVILDEAQNDEYEWVNFQNFKNFDYVPHTKEFIHNYFKSQKIAV